MRQLFWLSDATRDKNLSVVSAQFRNLTDQTGLSLPLFDGFWSNASVIQSFSNAGCICVQQIINRIDADLPQALSCLVAD